MSDIAHTEGPWEIVPQHGAGQVLIAHPFDTGKQMAPRGLRIIGFVMHRGNSLAEDDANARLIASAPDMKAEIERLRASKAALILALFACKHGAEYPDELGDIIDAALTNAKAAGMKPVASYPNAFPKTDAKEG